jgi:nucleoside-diphosphate-sugar epimerase
MIITHLALQSGSMGKEILNIFLTGATGNESIILFYIHSVHRLQVCTGYIGGAVLTKLLKHPEASSFKITAIVRSSDKASLLEKHGVQPLIGSHDDPDKVIPAAAEADVIFTTVRCFQFRFFSCFEGSMAL